MNPTVRTKAYRLPLRSKLLDWIESCPQNVATARQWYGMINNLKGVRSEEIERATIWALFDEDDERFNKADLIAEASLNLGECRPTIQSHWKHAFHPSLGVKTKRDTRPKRVEAKAKRFVEKAQTCYQHPSLGYWIIRTAYTDLATIAPNWILLDPYGKMIRSHHKHRGWFPSALEAFDEMHRVIRQRFAEFGRDRPATVFDEYTFLGGNNYQEWFVRLPEWPLPYQDGHFHLDQLLIHIRTTERINDNGQPLLLVEEIQSPWHADIRERGSFTHESELEDDENLVADAPFGKEWHELAIKCVIWLAIKQGFNSIGFTTGKQQCERWWSMEGLMNLYDLDVPKCLKKVASQYDCANGWTTIVTRKPVGKVRRAPKGEWIVENANKMVIAPPVKSKDVALHYLNVHSTPVKEQVRVLHVSDKLKQTMAGEIPLFGW